MSFKVSDAFFVGGFEHRQLKGEPQTRSGADGRCLLPHAFGYLNGYLIPQGLFMLYLPRGSGSLSITEQVCYQWRKFFTRCFWVLRGFQQPAHPCWPMEGFLEVRCPQAVDRAAAFIP